MRNIEKKEINAILDKEEKLNNKCIIIENDSYSGYRYSNSTFYFFIGGKEQVYEFDQYKIDIKVENKNYEELLEIEEEYILSDFTGGK